MKLVYLTGAPASGKSSMTRMLADRVPDLLVWEYGARLTEHAMSKSTAVYGQSDVRARSSAVISPEDVADVDRALLAFVEEHRGRRPILIDSHAVTKENFGFRITPFSLEQFGRLAPDEIWVFYASPEETRRRIGIDAGGRPMVSEDDAQTHSALQASVAATYGMSLGRPVYMFDTGASRQGLADLLAGRLT